MRNSIKGAGIELSSVVCRVRNNFEQSLLRRVFARGSALLQMSGWMRSALIFMTKKPEQGLNRCNGGFQVKDYSNSVMVVIIEWGTWGKSERDALREGAGEARRRRRIALPVRASLIFFSSAFGTKHGKSANKI